MSAPKVTARRPAWRLSDGAFRSARATVITEEPLQIIVDGAPYVVLMRTPGDDIALAAGFCLSEGLVDSAEELAAIRACDSEDRNQVAVTRAGARAAEGPPPRAVPHSIASSCGLCGRELIADLVQRIPPITGDFHISSHALLTLGRRLHHEQRYFQPTGGTHAAALFTVAGDLLAFAEDVGRHNALDMAIGSLLLHRRLPEAQIAVLSGRCSFEMVQKAARARLPLVASVSAPTDLAITLAEQVGITLVGFLRGETLTLYCHAGRLEDLP